ncbi:MAG: hypothetical protein KY410_07440 [Proteobacteria bacterium]|nr:hypothetical protein [Pseudomonadota bacterium]
MEKKNSTYRMPEGFDPYDAMDAIRGLVDAIHHFLLEGPGTMSRIPYPDKAGLNAIVELLRAQAHSMHDYIAELENRTTLELPRTQEELDALDFRHAKDDEVKDEPALYLVRR